MRAVKRVLAVAALTTPLVIGCAGLASATEGLDASFGQGFFTANQNGAGFGANQSSVSPDGLSHATAWTYADDTGVTGSFTGSGATWSAE
ncbi:hypothetical protein AB0E96_03800 [Kitasatospora sp. NPDC036755]|uniref:hypothetical protein n=1 Tax=Kitasatospora sp. NPDC036755 TaxID=3154600 RepID=UPI0033D587E0